MSKSRFTQYTNDVLNPNRQAKKYKKLSNRLNDLKRNLQDWLDNSDNSEALKDEDALNSQAFRTKFAPFLFMDAFRYQLWEKMLPSNPNGDRTPKEILQALKSGEENMITMRLSDTEKVELGNFTGEPGYTGEFKGGISVFRLLQVAYGIHKEYIREHGNGYLKKDLTETAILEAAKQYQERRNKRISERIENDTDEPTVQEVNPEQVGELTPQALLEQLEAKNVSVSEIENVGLLQETRELASGHVMGTITRRIKALQE